MNNKKIMTEITSDETDNRATAITKISKLYKTCSVCGDKSLGYNFGAIACESCKAFFRRNALTKKKLTCVFDGSCSIDVTTRRFCPACRLVKCFKVGMKKELIMGVADKQKRKEQIMQRRRMMMQKLNRDDTDHSEAGSETCTTATSSNPCTQTSALNSALNTECKVTWSSSAMKNCEPNLGSAEDENRMKSRRLTTVESTQLTDLIQMYDLSFTIDLEPLIHIRQLDPSLNQLVNQSSVTVLHLIKFAKRLHEFSRLSQECQIGLLKSCWIHLLLLRSMSLYDCDRDVWATPRGDIPTEILKNATGFVTFVELYEVHIRYCKSIKTLIGDDMTIVVLLMVVLLFSPEGAHIRYREVISNVQDQYFILLKHYLEYKYTFVRASEIFPELMSKMKELKEFAQVHGKFLENINPREIEPIMLEILDLK